MIDDYMSNAARDRERQRHRESMLRKWRYGVQPSDINDYMVLYILKTAELAPLLGCTTTTLEGWIEFQSAPPNRYQHQRILAVLSEPPPSEYRCDCDKCQLRQAEHEEKMAAHREERLQRECQAELKELDRRRKAKEEQEELLQYRQAKLQISMEREALLEVANSRPALPVELPGKVRQVLLRGQFDIVDVDGGDTTELDDEDPDDEDRDDEGCASTRVAS
jgi:hypothetical protein